MANVQVAIEFVLRLEDATFSGAIGEIAGDAGGATRFGISSVAHPELASSGFFTTMPAGKALVLAGQVLQAQYAAPMKIAEIGDQTLANVFLAYGVNEDPERAIEAMQSAVNVVLAGTPQIEVDGILGPLTLSQIARCMAGSLLNAFRLQMVSRYVEHAKDNVLRGLIRRALT